MRAETSTTNTGLPSRVGARARCGGRFVAYSLVKLTTNDYEANGLRKGEVGTVVDVLAHPRAGYTVEFHNISPDNADKVRTFEGYELELVKDAFAK